MLSQQVNVVVAGAGAGRKKRRAFKEVAGAMNDRGGAGKIFEKEQPGAELTPTW
jgi:hypothetical protein